MMTCGRARRLLWPDTGPREATPEVVEARAHVSRCELCRDFFKDMGRIGERIRTAAPRPHAPVEVRDRLFKAIARARTGHSGLSAGPSRWRVGMGLVATVVLGGAWLGYVVTHRPLTPASDPLSALVEDQLRSQASQRIVASDSLTVAQWLGDRVPFAVTVPLFPEARLTGARTLLVNRQLGAAVDYVISGKSLSYYVLPGRSGNSVRSQEIRLTSRSGYHLATWEDAGLTYALVAVLPEPELLALARYCIHQMVADLGRSRARLERSQHS
jgi:anti-sigma factor RsiW